MSLAQLSETTHFICRDRDSNPTYLGISNQRHHSLYVEVEIQTPLILEFLTKSYLNKRKV
jgi:hypothetical protein